METPDWNAYFRHVSGRMPRPEFLDALRLVPHTHGLVAVDLGAGDGVETVRLLERGWVVHSIDATPGHRERVASLFGSDPGDALVAREEQFGDIEVLPQAALVYAGYSLPFGSREEVRHVIDLVASSLVPGGIFAGHFFGEEDSWASRPDVITHTEREVEVLASVIGAHTIDERRFAGSSGRGMKHWHTRFVTAVRGDVSRAT